MAAGDQQDWATTNCSRAGKMPEYTHLQGQYLAFIYYYTKIHRCPPAEADMQRYFRVSPPSVHQMIVRLEENGFIKRTPGQARSIELLLPLEQLPRLE
jgi:DNA-binding MarR family transcriptional regulator